MYTKEHVTATAERITALNIERGVEMGTPDAFGLGLDLLDPVSGQIITVFRPQRSDIGQSEIALTAPQVAQAVAAARANRLHAVRAAGFASLEEADAAAKRDQEAAALAAKHADELHELQTTQAEATAKAAEEASAPAREKAQADAAEAEKEPARTAAQVHAAAQASPAAQQPRASV
jgi:hypothetical protein